MEVGEEKLIFAVEEGEAVGRWEGEGLRERGGGGGEGRCEGFEKGGEVCGGGRHGCGWYRGRRGRRKSLRGARCQSQVKVKKLE